MRMISVTLAVEMHINCRNRKQKSVRSFTIRYRKQTRSEKKRM